MGYEYYEKRKGKRGGVDILGWKRVTTGVLKGRMVKHYLGNLPTEEEAEGKYGEMNWYSPWTSPETSLNDLPGPEDPVPGGMYPDDW